MSEIGDVRGGFVLRYCSACHCNMWHKTDMCGVCGTTNTGKDKVRCRACGGMFDSLVSDHPLLQGQCAKCVNLYEEQNAETIAMIDDQEGIGFPCRQCGARYITSRAADACGCKPDNSHYTKGGIEPWDYIRENRLDFFEGSVVKYVTRWRHKNGIEDLRKAEVYIQELIRMEKAKKRAAKNPQSLATGAYSE